MRKLIGDESIFREITEIPDEQYEIVISRYSRIWDHYPLPDGRSNPGRQPERPGGISSALSPYPEFINESLNRFVQWGLNEEERWLLKIPRRIAKLGAIEARAFTTYDGRGAIIYPMASIADLFFVNELIYELRLGKDSVFDQNQRRLILSNLSALFANWLLRKTSPNLNRLGKVEGTLESLRYGRRQKREHAQIWEATSIQQGFLLLHEFGHLVQEPNNSFPKSQEKISEFHFDGLENEIEADSWACTKLKGLANQWFEGDLSCMGRPILDLFGVLEILRRDGYLVYKWEESVFKDRFFNVFSKVLYDSDLEEPKKVINHAFQNVEKEIILLFPADKSIKRTYKFGNSRGYPFIEAIGLIPEIEDGLASLQAKQYDKAFKILKGHAEIGDEKSQNDVGFLFYNGWGVNRDYSEARKWFSRAANQGFPESQHNLSILFRYGLGGEKNLEKADFWSENAKKSQLSKNKIGKLIKRIISERLNIDKDQISDNDSFDLNLGADSLDMLELVFGLEEALNINISDEKLVKIKTVEDAINCVYSDFDFPNDSLVWSRRSVKQNAHDRLKTILKTVGRSDWYRNQKILDKVKKEENLDPKTESSFASFLDLSAKNKKYSFEGFALLTEAVKQLFIQAQNANQIQNETVQFSGYSLMNALKEISYKNFGPSVRFELNRLGISSCKDVAEMFNILIESGFVPINSQFNADEFMANLDFNEFFGS